MKNIILALLLLISSFAFGQKKQECLMAFTIAKKYVAQNKDDLKQLQNISDYLKESMEKCFIKNKTLYCLEFKKKNLKYISINKDEAFLRLSESKYEELAKFTMISDTIYYEGEKNILFKNGDITVNFIKKNLTDITILNANKIIKKDK